MPLPQTGSGIEVLVYSDEGTAGRLAQNISAELSAVGWTDLGVKERPGLIVLRKTRLDTLAFDYFFGVLDWKKCDSLRPGTAGGSAGTAGGKFYVDELQAAIFLVYYCDGGDVRKEEKYGI